MSIHAINKSTDNYSGGGLPVYDKLDYIFFDYNLCVGEMNGLYLLECLMDYNSNIPFSQNRIHKSK